MKKIFRLGNQNIVTNRWGFIRFLSLNNNALLFKFVNKFLLTYPSSINLSYLWDFRFLALICLGIQIVLGIFLAMHYVANGTLAFVSIEHIIRNMHYGWLSRYTYVNGASVFFIVVYLYIFRDFYYSSYTYSRQLVGVSRVIIWILMIGTAFLGYGLPWGQMRFWAATVITNLIAAVSVIGPNFVCWLWSDFEINQATLTRFFSLHYLFPCIFLYLHYVLKYMFGLLILLIFGSIVFFFFQLIWDI